MKTVIPESITKVIQHLMSFPGYGEKASKRFTLNLLKMPKGEALDFIKELAQMIEKVTPCRECGLFTEDEICSICKDEERNRKTICVVEESFDGFIIEQTGKFNGLYHVLGGRLSPLEGITPENLNIDKLLKRIESLEIEEVLIATNPTVEGEATANYIHNLLKNKNISITRLAYGLPFGAVLENADEFTLSKAIEFKIKI
ncbi:MAG: recombination mediator RecR [Hydrogenothermaceae bacterium]